MKPPHLNDFQFAKDHSLQRASVIRRNTDLRRNETEVDQSQVVWQNELFLSFQDGFQQKPSSRGLHRTREIYSDPSTFQRTFPMEDGRQGIKPRTPLERTRKYWEDLPQRDILQRTNENHQRLKLKEVKNYERKGS
ncbi:hypothetical protein O181_111041 [Austropuccinia psidii MF-1]|uniref:Uncharacterized protein n=1 Tax=Austropuccinia psidii MF-1 TaxID=1389203 RepID=A0A9Q3PSC4_9BASI|nr:hypothetical protein [Austropuccinia psidii MF-1]